MCAPVWPAARTISSAPSMSVPGTSSIRSRACVNVGMPARAASAATIRYSSGLTPGAYPSSTPMPSAPSARSADSASMIAATCSGEAARCQRRSPRLARNPSSEVPGVMPATACIRAIAQDVEKP